MFDYSQNKSQTGLEPWHPLEEIGATILEGTPQQSGRIDFGSLETPMITGVWECTKGKFEVTYPWNELATILEGNITITDSKGNAMKFGPGDTHFAVKGDRVTWQIHSDKVRKAFFIYTGDQVAAEAAE
ncbi:MAG: cupin domain-containing protein [Proteobacteria bacterium]|nr:cupin domain-containing protein [Pseudomonadota bacterium]